MNDSKLVVSRWGGTATAMLLAFLLFYFPSVLSLFSRSGEPIVWSVTGVVMSTIYSVVFCINYFRLVPWMMLYPEKRSHYFCANAIIILLLCLLVVLWFKHTGGMPLPGGKRGDSLSASQYLLFYFRFLIRDGVMMVLAATLAYALRLSEAREKLRRQDLELSAEKRQIELKSLKAQLNPHFLFNSLNNIYALIGFAPERAQSALHDLSNMLRFMIYESGSAYVELAKEMQFISDYTALMKLRLNSNIKVTCSVIKYPPSEIRVAPLLFLTLVENAFKHVAPLPDGEGFIKIAIEIDDYKLSATVANTTLLNPQAETAGSKTNYIPGNTGSSDISGADHGNESGVGLENVKRQLSLLYPDAFTFSISNNKGIFTASISILLSALRSKDVINREDK